MEYRFEHDDLSLWGSRELGLMGNKKMKSVESTVCLICLCAGSVFGSSGSPTTLSPTNGRVVDVAHIYFNIATGERVVTLLGDGQTTPADTGTGGPIWSSLVGNTCAEQGFTTSFFFGLDNNAGTTPFATGMTALDFGDIETDTVVDCVRIEWVTAHEDTDSDSDGVGDGVVGLAGEWTYWDGENGRSDRCDRFALISFRLTDLPGTPFGDGTPAGYSADIDLVGSFSSSMTFELGDTDSDSQGAAFYTPGYWLGDHDFDGQPDTDFDGDGLFDWGWSVRFFQPGTADHDGDGVIDGDIADSMRTIGIRFGSPEGEAIDNGDGTWTWEIDTLPLDAGTGSEDAFAMYDGYAYVGFFWFGGFSCTPDLGGQYTPRADFRAQLFGPSGSGPICCPADMNCDGTLNFFDISEFLAFFAAGDMQADINGDGTLNFFDISLFLAMFSAGCP